MKNELTSKRATRYTLVLGLAILGALCTTALAHQQLDATYVTTAVEHDGAYIVHTGPGQGTIVGKSVLLARVHFEGKKAVVLLAITAANGDELNLQGAQTFDEATQSWVGAFTVVGGTGRFADAHGGGTVIAKANSDGTVTAILDGTISL